MIVQRCSHITVTASMCRYTTVFAHTSLYLHHGRRGLGDYCIASTEASHIECTLGYQLCSMHITTHGGNTIRFIIQCRGPYYHVTSWSSYAMCGIKSHRCCILLATNDSASIVGPLCIHCVWELFMCTAGYPVFHLQPLVTTHYTTVLPHVTLSMCVLHS